MTQKSFRENDMKKQENNTKKKNDRKKQGRMIQKSKRMTQNAGKTQKSKQDWYENKAEYTATICGRVGRGGNARFPTF